MIEEYSAIRTSKNTSIVDDIIFWETKNTRKILRAIIIGDNPKNPEAGIKITILHQKSIGGAWEDIKGKPLSTLKAGEIVHLSLASEETLALFRELNNLYAIHGNAGLANGTKRIVVGFENEIIKTDPQRAEVIRKLVKQGHSKELWEQLVESDPHLATKLSYSRLYQSRKLALDQFEKMLGNNHPEPEWQKFFEVNKWIFGYGLNYQILKPVTAQPHYGGESVAGIGQNRGDFLKATQAEVKFTVLVEIKRPSTALLKTEKYRNGVYVAGEDLVGGVAQLRGNAHQWQVEGSRTDSNRDELEEKSIYTVQPKKILVIGGTAQLDSRSERESFELFRRNQMDVEILCFDEVLERARFILDYSGENGEQDN